MRILAALCLALGLVACSTDGIDPNEPIVLAKAAERLVACENEEGVATLTCRYQRACEVANAVVGVKAEIGSERRPADFGYASYLMGSVNRLAQARETFYPRAELAIFATNFAGLLGEDLSSRFSALDLFNLSSVAIESLAKLSVGKGYLQDAIAHMEAIEDGTLDPDAAFAACSASIAANVAKLSKSAP